MVGSSRSKSNLCSSSSGTICTPNSHSGNHRFRLLPINRVGGNLDLFRKFFGLHPRRRNERRVLVSNEISQNEIALSFINRNVWTPKPSIMRKLRGNRSVRHHPHDHVHRFRHQRNKIPESIVCGCSLWNFIMRFWFYRMDEIRKFDGILNEKDGHIISDQIVIAFLRIKLNRKPANISCQISGPPGTRHSRKTNEYRRF